MYTPSEQQDTQESLKQFIEQNCIQPFLNFHAQLWKVCIQMQERLQQGAEPHTLSGLQAQAKIVVAASRQYMVDLQLSASPVLSCDPGSDPSLGFLAYDFYHAVLQPPLTSTDMELRTIHNREVHDALLQVEKGLSSLQTSLEAMQNQSNVQLMPTSLELGMATVIAANIDSRHKIWSNLMQTNHENCEKTLENEQQLSRIGTICTFWHNHFPLPWQPKTYDVTGMSKELEIVYWTPKLAIQIETDSPCDQIQPNMRALIADLHLELIHNSLQAMGEQIGMILLQMRIIVDEDDTPFFLSRVQDTGPGFSPTILNAWNQGDEYTSTTGGSGTYIGTTRKFILDLGGTVQAKNMTEKGGASITIKIPFSALRAEKQTD